MAIAVLSVDLVAKLATFEADLKKAAGIAERQSGAMSKAFGLASAGAAGLVGALSVGQVAAFFKGVTDGLDALNDFADATGTSVENASALEDVAKRTGASIDVARDAVLKLNQQLNSAKPGSDTEKALQAIGLSAKELRALDPAEALLTVSKALAGYADDGAKARITQELFGKSTREVAAYLKDLADQGELVAKVTSDQAAEAERFNKQLASMEKNALDVARRLELDLLPAATKYLGLMHEALGGPKTDDTLKTELDTLRRQAQQLRELDGKGYTVFGFFGSQEERDAELAKVLAQTKKIEEAYLRLNSAAGAGRGAFNPGDENPRSVKDPFGEGGSGGKSKATKTPRAEMAETTQGMADALRAIDDTDIAKARELEAALSELYTLQRETRGDPAVVKAIKATKDALALLTPEGKRAAEAQKLFASALEDTPTAKLDVTTRAIELLNKRLADGKISIEEWAEAARLITKNAAADSSNKLDELSQFAAQAASNIQDAFGDTLLQTMKGSTSDIGKLWGDLIQRMISQAAAAKFGEALFGKDFAKTGDIGGLAKDGFDWLKGLGGKKADGAASGEGGKSSDPVATMTEYVQGGFEKLFGDMNGTIADKLGGGLESILGDIGSSLSGLMSSLFGGGSGGGGFAGLLGSLFSFDGGGSTGSGPRTGGLDGKGGFLSLMHPQETVIDHTKGGRLGGDTYATSHTWNIYGASDPRETARIVEQRLAQYDKQQRRRAAYGA
ncbi:hypothetical protein [Rubrivivax gelatinosus]|uniref:hypothetical protein n=1 Tax=Rubrivivax gelatinosus TaxID=28068 RepID=UPI0002EDB81B|nr:hypothetical protein [Rubrivivax gelatinosus]MBG6082707.1 hypothetical protein [Rubrivivax gelatinosus]